MKRDTFQQLTKKNDSIEIRNGEMFRLACCDCHLVHNVTVSAEGLAPGAPLVIQFRRNPRKTKSRRKLKEKP